MLSETFIAATSAAPKLTQANSSAVKDAGIFMHSFQPSLGLQSTFKKSATSPNCVAISSSHVYAAQSGKATIHIYSREKGNHEATIPFPERIRSIVLSTNEAVLFLGTETGTLLIWEIATGRQLATASAHLRAVTCLAIDEHNGFLLSGSEDSTVLVWTYLDLLTFHNSLESFESQRTPIYTLSAHSNPITSLVTGHASYGLNLTISASEDKSIILWNHHNGQHLKTYLLDSIPRSLAIDPADRAIFAGLENGGIQMIDFYPLHGLGIASDIHRSESGVVSLNEASPARWSAPSTDLGPATTISISFDGTTVISGHTSGSIISWNVATGQSGAPLAKYEDAPITTVRFIKPKGFTRDDSELFHVVAPIRPKPHEEFSSANGKLTGNYNFHIQLLGSGDSSHEGQLQSLFDDDGVPSTLQDTLASDGWGREAAGAASSTSQREADFMSLDGGSEIEIKFKHYQDQIEHLKKLQRVSNRRHEQQQHEINDLRKRTVGIDGIATGAT